MTRALFATALTAALIAGCTSAPDIGDAVGPERCDAAAAQSLVGTHVGAVTFPADANVRVVCTTCPTTRDYRPDRLNVRFDEETGIIEKVDCG